MSLKPKSRDAAQPAVVTANRLVDGHVVWRNADGAWVDAARDAAILRGAELERALAGALRDERAQIVVGAYATDVMSSEPRPVPLLLRERIRAEGPTIAVGPAAVAIGA